jgi:hypothetical protein
MGRVGTPEDVRIRPSPSTVIQSGLLSLIICADRGVDAVPRLACGSAHQWSVDPDGRRSSARRSGLCSFMIRTDVVFLCNERVEGEHTSRRQSEVTSERKTSPAPPEFYANTPTRRKTNPTVIMIGCPVTPTTSTLPNIVRLPQPPRIYPQYGYGRGGGCFLTPFAAAAAATLCCSPVVADGAPQLNVEGAEGTALVVVVVEVILPPPAPAPAPPPAVVVAAIPPNQLAILPDPINPPPGAVAFEAGPVLDDAGPP